MALLLVHMLKEGKEMSRATDLTGVQCVVSFALVVGPIALGVEPIARVVEPIAFVVEPIALGVERIVFAIARALPNADLSLLGVGQSVCCVHRNFAWSIHLILSVVRR